MYFLCNIVKNNITVSMIPHNLRQVKQIGLKQLMIAEPVPSLPLQHVFFGEARYLPEGQWGPRIQQDYQLVLLHEGSVTITIDNTQHQLNTNEVCLLHPGHEEHFQFTDLSPSVHTWCALTCTKLNDIYTSLLADLPFKTPISTRMKQLMRLGIDLGYVVDPVINLMRCRLAESMLLDFILCAHGNIDLVLPKAQPVHRVQRYIELHFTEPIDMRILGDVAHLSPAHLSRLFRKQTGVTPIQYLWDIRLRRALQMLIDTGIPVAEVSWRTGFKTPAHFSRAIKERCGVTPKEFRQRTWQGLAPHKSNNY